MIIKKKIKYIWILKKKKVIWERSSTPQTTVGQKSECISMKILIWGEIGSNAYIGIRNAFKNIYSLD